MPTPNRGYNTPDKGVTDYHIPYLQNFAMVEEDLQLIASGQIPFDDPPYTLPAVIDASHFDLGGEGVAYHQEGTFRDDFYGFREDETTVGIENPDLGGSGDGSIGFVRPGEWMEWTVESPQGNYLLSVDIASRVTGSMRVLVEGTEVGSITTTTDTTYDFQRRDVGNFSVDQFGFLTIRVEWTQEWLNLDRIIVEEA